LRILADQVGNLLNIDELASSVGIAKETVYNYLGKKKRSKRGYISALSLGNQ